jgi:hypothetical protein
MSLDEKGRIVTRLCASAATVMAALERDGDGAAVGEALQCLRGT